MPPPRGICVFANMGIGKNICTAGIQSSNLCQFLICKQRDFFFSNNQPTFAILLLHRHLKHAIRVANDACAHVVPMLLCG